MLWICYFISVAVAGTLGALYLRSRGKINGGIYVRGIVTTAVWSLIPVVNIGAMIIMLVVVVSEWYDSVKRTLVWYHNGEQWVRSNNGKRTR